MKRVSKLFAVAAYASVSGIAAAAGTRTDIMERYYQKDDSSQLGDFWDRTVARGVIGALPQSQELIVGFFGGAFRKHPEVLKSRVTALEHFSKKQRDAVSVILWLSDSSDARAILRRAALDHMASTPCPAVGQRKILSSDDVQFLVGWFYATGDTQAISPIVEYVITADWKVIDSRADACGGALITLCEGHEAVRSLVDDALKRPSLSDGAREALLAARKKTQANSESSVSQQPTQDSG